MSNETDPFASLGTLSTQLLGVVTVLTQELVRARVVDADRLRDGLEAFWAQELGVAGLPDGERRMIESVKRVVSAALVQEVANGQGD